MTNIDKNVAKYNDSFEVRTFLLIHPKRSLFELPHH